MTPLVREIGGRELALTLGLAQLREVAKVNGQFDSIRDCFLAGVWDFREVEAIVGAALRPHGMTVASAFEALGMDGLRDLAADLWMAAMRVPPEVVDSWGKARAAALIPARAAAGSIAADSTTGPSSPRGSR